MVEFWPKANVNWFFIDLRLDIHLHSQLVTAIEQALRELGVGAVRAVELKHLALFGILGDLGVAVEGQVVAVLSGVGTLAVFEVILGNRTGASSSGVTGSVSLFLSNAFRIALYSVSVTGRMVP
mgnify:CR=1 FL=1